MTSKTFKSAFEDSSYRLEVCKNAGAEHVSLWILGCGLASTSIAIADKDSPALALSILEAAGAHKDSQDFLGGAVEQLKFHIGEQERITAAAKEQAELEAEALELLNAEREEFSCTPVRDLSEVPARDQRAAIAVARRAREMRAEK